MGLDVIVGALADVDDMNKEWADAVRADFATVDELLGRHNVGPWAEPELNATDVYEGRVWGYSGLHTLRRLAAHLAEHGNLPEPLDDSQRATDDPVLKKAYACLPFPGDPAGPYDHLIHHSDCEGYYVPVDFEAVILDEALASGYLGSSVRLLDECRRLAAVIGVPEDPDPDGDEIFDVYDAETPVVEGWRRYPVESSICLRLIDAAKHSIATGAALVFC